jgi:predicted RNA-binding Zn-ribbon protein involved in translation (DUF1610 family)
MTERALGHLATQLMPRHSYPWSRKHVPGSWKGIVVQLGDRSASFTCPKCGTTMALVEHRIDRRGKVWPSVVCPKPKCSFHEHIRLAGWREV